VFPAKAEKDIDEAVQYVSDRSAALERCRELFDEQRTPRCDHFAEERFFVLEDVVDVAGGITRARSDVGYRRAGEAVLCEDAFCGLEEGGASGIANAFARGGVAEGSILRETLRLNAYSLE
jgi:hypothetical protein